MSSLTAAVVRSWATLVLAASANIGPAWAGENTPFSPTRDGVVNQLTFNLAPPASMNPEIFPADGESWSLTPKGPIVLRQGHTLKMSFGLGWSAGYMLASYGKKNALERVELFNPRGKRIQWTEYRDEGGRKSVITASDPGETGQATRWESWTSAPDREGRPQAIRLVEEWDPRAKARRQVSREEFDANQACTLEESKAAAAVSVQQIVDGYSGSAACPATPEAAGFKVTGDAEKHDFAPLGPVCLDGGCPICADPGKCKLKREEFAGLLKDTFREGAQCLAGIGMDSLKEREGDRNGAARALRQIGQEKNLSDGNAAFLQKSFALKNAGMMLMIYNQSQNTGKPWNSKEQNWAKAKAGDDSLYRGATDDEAKAEWKAPTGPIKFLCSRSTDLTFERAAGAPLGTVKARGSHMPWAQGGDGGVKANADGTVQGNVSERVTGASAAMPGTPGWPLIRLNPAALTAYGDDTAKAILFHELMHLLGYPHSDKDLTSASGGNTIPTHSACQICCFPKGFAKNGTDSCQEDRKNCDACLGNADYQKEAQKAGLSIQALCSDHCTAAAKPECQRCGKVKQAACDVCAGKWGTGHDDAAEGGKFGKVRDEYAKGVKSCYSNGQPL